MSLPTFNQSASFINSLPNFNQQGQQAVLNSAANLNQGSSGMRVSNAVPTAPWAGPNTQLTVAGQTGYQQPSQNLPQFALNPQGNIPSGPPPGYSGPPANVIWPDATASGPGGVRKGDYDARGLSQDQRQWLWEQFGHSGQAPLGYGGERPPAPTPPPAPVAPPPAMPPQTQVAAKPIGSTAALPSVGATGAVGQKAFGATTAAGLAGKDLQSIKGLPLSLGGAPQVGASAQMTPTIPTRTTPQTITPEFIQQLQQNTGANVPVVSQKPPWQMPIVPIPTPTPGEDVQKSQERVRQELERQQNEFMRGKITSIDPYSFGQSKAIYNPKLTDTGIEKEVVTDPTKKFPAMATVLPVEQHGQVLQMYNTGQISKEDTVSAIASPEAKVSIGKMINTAVKAGDFGAAKRLADLAPAIDEQLALINQIGRAVLATSQGFGTPNAPGVTEARMPMVQMGVGQALTTPRPDFSRAPMSAQSATLAPYLRPRFDEVERNRPPIFPYMNGQ